MITKDGKFSEWVQTMSSQQKSLIWCANYTQNITSIVFTNPAPATQKLLDNGLKS